MRDSQLRGRLRLRHLLEHTEARGEDMDAMRPRFAALADPSSAPRTVSVPLLFQTPEHVAAQCVELLGEGRPLGRTLEPSAGLGRLYRAVRRVDSGCSVVLVEIAAACAAELYRETAEDSAAHLVQDDFLGCDCARLGGPFDSVLMNPPFRRGLDIRHVEHAASLLAPGGRLVSVVAAGPRQRAAFAGRRWIDLPPGTFRESGTDVAAALVVIEA